MGRPKKIKPAKAIIINEEANLKWRNELINGKYSLTLLEMRMVMALAGHVAKNADEFECGSISVKDLGEFMGLGEEERYSKIKTLSRNLRRRELFFEWYSTPQSKRKSWLTTGWFDYIMYDDEHTTLEFQFASKIEPMLLKVQEAYVQLKCKPLMAFKCMYSNRFLMMFVEWERIQPRTIEISELRELLQLGDKYKYFKDFRQYVVDPAMKEINGLTDFNVKAVPQKTGRAYTHYKFMIRRKPKEELEAMDTTVVEVPTNETSKEVVNQLTEEQQALLNELCGYGIVKKTVLSFLKEFSVDRIKKNIEYVKRQDKQGVVRNFTKFMISAIKEDFAESDENSKEARLTPKQKEEQAELRKQAQEIEDEMKKSKESVDDVENEKDNIRKEFLELDEAEQRVFIDYLRSEAEKFDNPFKKNSYVLVLAKDYNFIINDKTALNLVVNLIYGLRHG